MLVIYIANIIFPSISPVLIHLLISKLILQCENCVLDKAIMKYIYTPRLQQEKKLFPPNHDPFFSVWFVHVSLKIQNLYKNPFKPFLKSLFILHVNVYLHCMRIVINSYFIILFGRKEIKQLYKYFLELSCHKVVFINLIPL